MNPYDGLNPGNAALSVASTVAATRHAGSKCGWLAKDENFYERI